MCVDSVCVCSKLVLSQQEEWPHTVPSIPLIVCCILMFCCSIGSDLTSSSAALCLLATWIYTKFLAQ